MLRHAVCSFKTNVLGNKNKLENQGIKGLGRLLKGTGTCMEYREYNTLAKYISTGKCTK